MGTSHKLGLGMGWRPELAPYIGNRADVGFVEVLAESITHGDGAGFAVPEPIFDLLEKGIKTIVHGVSLSLGGAEPPSGARLTRLARIATSMRAELVSEHLAFVRGGGIESGHLLPIARTEEMIDIAVENIKIAKRHLSVPLAIENIASLVEWPGAEMSEAEFLSRVVEEADCLLLLDISNLYANAVNHGFDPVEYLEQLPLERIAYVHIAGGIKRSGLYHDTHAHAVSPESIALLSQLCRLWAPPGVLLERDDRFPKEYELDAELHTIARALYQKSRRTIHQTLSAGYSPKGV